MAKTIYAALIRGAKLAVFTEVNLNIFCTVVSDDLSDDELDFTEERGFWDASTKECRVIVAPLGFKRVITNTTVQLLFCIYIQNLAPLCSRRSLQRSTANRCVYVFLGFCLRAEVLFADKNSMVVFQYLYPPNNLVPQTVRASSCSCASSTSGSSSSGESGQRRRLRGVSPLGALL